MLAVFEADSPLRARRAATLSGALGRDLNYSSFAPELCSAVEKTAACHGRNASCQRAGVVVAAAAAAARAVRLIPLLMVLAVCVPPQP